MHVAQSADPTSREAKRQATRFYAPSGPPDRSAAPGGPLLSPSERFRGPLNGQENPTFLGRDGDPQRAVYEQDALVGWTAVKLAEALDQACCDLRKGGQENAMRRALLVLRRFHRWQATGRW